MNRPDPERNETSAAAELASAADERFWQAFAQAAGFDDELRELVAAGEIDAVEANLDAAIAPDASVADELLSADRLYGAMLAVRDVPVEPATIELASRCSSEEAAGRPRRRTVWYAALTGVALALAAWAATAVFLSSDGTGAGSTNAEIASAERLAQEWIAVHEESVVRDVGIAEEVELDADSAVDPFDFEETPGWLMLVVTRQAQLAGNGIEEATP